MNELLAEIITSHGGISRWNGYEKVEATIVSGGGFFPLKGVPQDFNPAPHEHMAARGTLICFTLRCFRSAHSVHSIEDRNREARWNARYGTLFP